ncbi:beta-lactamase-like protein [Fimicolochytrium jonesii]|uniref:beta-lactamase-like protein n=1 Tax=Fimicolochytrium jonesii TaxID=1396493 RepID=UPI0022FE14C8|nr:beta-lactamase-like protein [Fimicolochytrium jonesii]KAI8825616.1 beta-lactamase-like protein [Fimicolochytrium jonesii]
MVFTGAQVTPLSKSPQYPCSLLELQDARIILDCALEVVVNTASNERTPTWVVPPFLDCDIESVEAVILTNCYNALALPFLTEYTKFAGAIYATEPTVEFARLLLEELVNTFARDQHRGGEACPVRWGSDSIPLYSLHDIQSCLAKIRLLHYAEIKELNDHGDHIVLTPLSSGFCLGSANWIIETPNGKISYIAASSNSEIGHSAMIDLRAFAEMDAAIITQVGSPRRDPSLLKNSISDMLRVVVRALENRGNVLFPCFPCGTMFDVIGFVSDYIKAAGYLDTPMHVVSPLAKRALHMANIQGEWMSADKQSSLYQARQPLRHGQLLEERSLHYHETPETVFSFRGPHIVFAGYAGPLSGDAEIFLKKWSQNANNLLVLTEPLAKGSIPMEDGFSMQICECLIETRPSRDDLISKLNANRVFYLRGAKNPGNLPISPSPTMQALPLVPLQIGTIPFTRDVVKATILEEVARVTLSQADAVVIGGSISTKESALCTIQALPHATVPGYNNRAIAEQIAADCASQLGPARMQFFPTGIVLDWGNGAHKIALEQDDIRIEAADVHVLEILRSTAGSRINSAQNH